MAETAYGILGTVRLRGKPGGPWADEWAVNTFHFAGTVDNPLSLNRPQQEVPTFGVDFEAKTRVIQVQGADVTVEQGFKGDALPVVGAVFRDDDWDALAGELMSWRTGLTNVGGYILQDVRLYPVNADGTAVNKWVSIYQPAGLEFDDGPNLSNPPSTAIVLSHYTPTRTRKGRGRVYVPGVPVADATTDRMGLIPANLQTLYAQEHGAFLSRVRAISTSVLSPMRFTPIVFNRGLSPTCNVINRVRVGDEYDHQQRRRRQRTEQYVEQNLT